MSDTNGAGGFVELAARIDAHIGAIHDLSRELRKPRRPLVPVQPVFGRSRASVTVGSSGVAVLRFDQAGPTQGYFWYVRSIVVGGLTPTTTAAGRADVYVVAGHSVEEIGTLAGVGLSDWRDQAATLPSVAFYGRGELPLRFNERLSIVLSNATNGQQYVAAVQFEQIEEAASKQTWDL